MRQAGLFGLSDHMKRLSADGDLLEVLARVVDFEAFRSTLVSALAYSDGTKGGRPPYDPVVMLKMLVLAAQNNVSDARMEWLIRDRLSWLRFLRFDLGAATLDANTIRTFRERLTGAGALDALFADFDGQLKARGYLPMGGQIVDATLVAAPKQRNTEVEKVAVKEGKSAPELWLQKQYLDLPRLWVYPQEQDDGWCALRRAHVARRGHGRQHRVRCVGRYCLPQPEQRALAEGSGPG